MGNQFLMLAANCRIIVHVIVKYLWLDAKKNYKIYRFLSVGRFKIAREELQNNILCVLVISSEEFRRLVLRSCRRLVLPRVLNQFLV